MSSDNVVRTKAGVPVNADFENIVTRDGGFTRVYLVIDTNTGRPYTRLSDGTIQPLALGEGTAPQSLATDSSPTFAGTTLSGLTASQAVFTDGSKALVSNAVTGSGNVVMSASPTLTGTVSAATVNATNFNGVLGAATPAAASVTTLNTSGTATIGGNITLTAGGGTIILANDVSYRGLNAAANATFGLVKVNASDIVVVDDDNRGTRIGASGTSPLTAGATSVTTLSASGAIKAGGYTVATLPSGSGGEIAYVTDQLAAPNAKGAAPTGGGAILCYQVHNGTGWVGL